MSNLLFQRLSQVSVLPELRAALVDLLDQDWSSGSPAVQEHGTLYAALASIFGMLGGCEQKALELFLIAWYTLRAAVLCGEPN